MSNRTVLLWLAAAIAVGIAAFLVLRGGRGAPGASGGVVASGQRVIPIEPAKVIALSVARGSSAGDAVSRPAGSDEWTLNAGAPDAWPVATSRIAAMLRLLADARATGEPEASATVGDDPTIVTITQDDGSVVTLRLAARTLAGAGLVSVESTGGTGTPSAGASQLALIDDNIHRAVREPGPRGWRSANVLAGFDPNPPRIRLESSSGVLALRRVENRWGVTEPMVAPADPAKVAGLMKSLGEMAIADFLDTPPAKDATTGLNPASATITLESDAAPAGGGGGGGGAGSAGRTGRRTVELGGPADSSGKHLYARIDGARTVVLDAAGLAGIAMSPAAYIASTATPLAAPDIGSVVMTNADGAVGRRLVREADGWTEVLPSGRGSLLAEADRSSVNDAVKFLIERPATEIGVSAPKGYTSVGTLELGGLDGRGLDTLEIGVAEGPMLTIKSGAVYRSYPLGSAPSVLRAWVEPKAPKPPGADGKTGEPMK